MNWRSFSPLLHEIPCFKLKVLNQLIYCLVFNNDYTKYTKKICYPRLQKVLVPATNNPSLTQELICVHLLCLCHVGAAQSITGHVTNPPQVLTMTDKTDSYKWRRERRLLTQPLEHGTLKGDRISVKISSRSFCNYCSGFDINEFAT